MLQKTKKNFVLYIQILSCYYNMKYFRNLFTSLYFQVLICDILYFFYMKVFLSGFKLKCEKFETVVHVAHNVVLESQSCSLPVTFIPYLL